MKKQHFDVLEEVYSVRMIPDTVDVNSPKNKDWWKNVHHSTEDESSKPGMYLHQIAFDGLKPLVVKQVNKGNERLYSCNNFVSIYKKR